MNLDEIATTTTSPAVNQSTEFDTRQVYLIQTEGPDGLQNTEVVITDLGEIGDDAIVVFEEAVGGGVEVGAEETVIEAMAAATSLSCPTAGVGGVINGDHTVDMDDLDPADVMIMAAAQADIVVTAATAAAEEISGGANVVVTTDDVTGGGLLQTGSVNSDDVLQVKLESLDGLEAVTACDVKLEHDLGVQHDLGVHYETVEELEMGEDAHRSFLGLELPDDDLSNETTTTTSTTTTTTELASLDKLAVSPDQLLTDQQPLNLVKKDGGGSSRRKLAGSGDSKLFFCKLCNAYISALLKASHNRDVHGNHDKLACADCGKLFTSRRSLFGHKKEKHSGALDIFTCPECGKNFSRKSNLKAHRDSLHFGKKFACHHCTRIFTNRSSMNQHIKKTHLIHNAVLHIQVE